MLWIEAARPRTLIASVAPVTIGLLWVARHGSISFPMALWTFLGAVLIQIGTNFTNDYYDCLQGADTAARKGPRRLVASGLLSPKHMGRASGVVFALAGCIGLYMASVVHPWFLMVPVVSIALGIAYTRGVRSIAYLGLGECVVFVVLGPCATAATAYLQTHTLAWEPLLWGVIPGSLSSAILVVNNLRDRDEDARVGKNTLAVRYGNRWSQILYTACSLAGIVGACLLGMWGAVLAVPFLFRPLRTVWNYDDPKQLNLALAQTGGVLVCVTVLMSLQQLLEI